MNKKKNPSQRTTAKPVSVKSAAEPQAAAPSVEMKGRHRSAQPAKSPVQQESVNVPAPVEQKSVAQTAAITQEDISRLAFSYFEQRGYQGGSAHEDWVRAEQELLPAAR